MMKLSLRDGLLFIAVRLSYQGHTLDLEHVLLDTGSVSSIFAADQVATLGIFPSPQDTVYRMHCIGGSEFVFTRRVNSLAVGDLGIQDTEIQVGAMNYGLEISGILGMDFLLQTQALIDLHRLELLSATKM